MHYEECASVPYRALSGIDLGQGNAAPVVIILRAWGISCGH